MIPAAISVIVPTNRISPLLHRCLASLAGQYIDLPVEILLVVNGPASGLSVSLPGVKVLHETKRGPAASRNKGVSASKGEYIAFIDSDCIASPRWLNSAVSALQNKMDAAVVAGRIVRTGADRSWVSLFDSVSYLQQENYVRYSGACVTANVVMRRSTFERVGAFDEQFYEAACEDWEWSGRARQAQVTIMYDAFAIVEHPCMLRLCELRLKARRLGRGEVILRQKQQDQDNEDASNNSLVREIYRQIRRIGKVKGVRSHERVALYLISLLVAFWIWNSRRLILSGDCGDSNA